MAPGEGLVGEEAMRSASGCATGGSSWERTKARKRAGAPVKAASPGACHSACASSGVRHACKFGRHVTL